jgi:HK97 family phage prohead protease
MTILKHDLMTLRFSPLLEAKFSANGGVVEGYGSTFGGQPDSYGDVVAPGAFARSLREHKEAGTMPALLWAHDPERPIGRWIEMREDNRGLFVTGQLNVKSTAGSDAYEHLKAGDVTGLSIGFTTPPGGRQERGDGVEVLVDVNLWEVSAVVFPANRNARVTSVKSISSMREFEVLLQDVLRLPRAAAKKLAAGGYPALAKVEDDLDPETIAAAIRQSAERFKKGS